MSVVFLRHPYLSLRALIPLYITSEVACLPQGNKFLEVIAKQA